MNSHRWIPSLAWFFLACALNVFAATDGTLLERSACVFPAYEKVRGIETYATPAEYEATLGDHRFTCEKLNYSSGGLSVVAYLYRPAETANRKMPLIIFNRGGYVVKDQLPFLTVMFHRLAGQGFAVIAPMYRGSDGAEGHDELGGADLADLTNVLPLAAGLGFIDSENIFLYGESRGGVMVFLALRDGFQARAAATFGAFTDLGAYLQGDPRASQIVQMVWPDYNENKEAILAARSIKDWPDRIKTPILLMHGGADREVSPMQTLSLASRFEELKKEYSLYIVAGDTHTLSKHRVERDDLAVRWFKEHMN